MSLSIHTAPNPKIPPPSPVDSKGSLPLLRSCSYTASFLGGIIHKIRLFAQEFFEMLPIDWAALSDSFRTFISPFSSLTTQAGPTLSSDVMNWLDVTTTINHVSLGWKWIKGSPFFLGLRILTIARQTSDFALTFLRWIKGKSPLNVLAHQTINTSFTWLPFVLGASKLARSHPASYLISLLTLSFYSYSVFDDARQYSKEKRRKSPTLELVGNTYRYLTDPSPKKTLTPPQQELLLSDMSP